MVMTKEQRRDVVEKSRVHETDTGSPEVQASLLTERIAYMTGHMEAHPKDVHSKRGLQAMVNRRKTLLAYLRREEPERYRTLVESLGLRK